MEGKTKMRKGGRGREEEEKPRRKKSQEGRKTKEEEEERRSPEAGQVERTAVCGELASHLKERVMAL
jgi:hypothetical protein